MDVSVCGWSSPNVVCLFFVGFDQEIFRLIVLALLSVEYAKVLYGLYRIGMVFT